MPFRLKHTNLPKREPKQKTKHFFLNAKDILWRHNVSVYAVHGVMVVRHAHCSILHSFQPLERRLFENYTHSICILDWIVVPSRNYEIQILVCVYFSFVRSFVFFPSLCSSIFSCFFHAFPPCDNNPRFDSHTFRTTHVINKSTLCLFELCVFFSQERERNMIMDFFKIFDLFANMLLVFFRSRSILAVRWISQRFGENLKGAFDALFSDVWLIFLCLNEKMNH